MDLIIQSENLIYGSKYVEYHVPPSIDGGPTMKLLVHRQGEGCVAILFIPNTPHTKPPLDFLQETVQLHWQTLGSHIKDFVCYSFDRRIECLPKEIVGLGGFRSEEAASLKFQQEYQQMSLTVPPRELSFHPGILNTKSEAHEMGYVECDGVKLLREVEEKARRVWLRRLSLSWDKIVDNPAIKIRAMVEESTSEPVAFLPYLIGSQGAVLVKPLWVERSRRDWRHARRVLYRSVHDECIGKELLVNFEAENDELRSFLHGWGYSAECFFWCGIYYCP